MTTTTRPSGEHSDAALRELRAGVDRSRVHLNHAGCSPLTARAQQAMHDVPDVLRDGSFGIGALLRRYEEARGSFARLVGAAHDDVAFFQTCASAISQVAFGLPLSSGDEIVLLDQEYPSNAYPWHVAARRAGARVVVVSSREDLTIDPARIVDAITPRTRVVAVSWVQFQTGSVVDLKLLADAVHAVGGLLCVDAIQGLGVMPFDLGALGVDVVCGGNLKWLLGPIGHGFLAMRPGLAETFDPIMIGAITYGMPEDAVEPDKAMRAAARRFEPGGPLLSGAIGSAASIELLHEIGIARVHDEAMRLANLIRVEATRRGYDVFPSSSSSSSTLAPSLLPSPIVTFRTGDDVHALASKLQQRGVSVAVRAGGLRVSPHADNVDDDVDRLFAAIDAP